MDRVVEEGLVEPGFHLEESIPGDPAELAVRGGIAGGVLVVLHCGWEIG